MKTPFTLEAWLADKSQQVETTFGKSAKIVFTDGLGERQILAVIYDGDTTDCAWYSKDGKSIDSIDDLFLVTPNPALTEWEEAVAKVLFDWEGIEPENRVMTDSVEEAVKETAAELLAIARKEIEKELPWWRAIAEDTKEFWKPQK